MEKKPDLLKPALIGGVFTGVLSGLPGIGIFNIVCCLWVIIGAMIASYILTKESPIIVKSGDGALTGILSGLFGAIISAILHIPFQSLNAKYVGRIVARLMEISGEGMPPGFDDFYKGIGKFSINTLPFFFIGLIFNMILFAMFGALGGLIGAALFKKKELPQPPVPSV
ncbi:MAG: hypothetical protein AB1410_08835 [Acidobacteriota bacterium]